MKLYAEGWNDYELIDAGGGKKLERFGEIITIRPEVQAYFPSVFPLKDWQKKAHFEFVETGKNKGDWKALKQLPVSYKWAITYESLVINLELTKFKHVGIFPEQNINWQFIHEHLEERHNFLNLFAYTGVASLVASAAGATAVHVDAVKQLVTWSKENMISSGLDDIKWVVEDALKFAQREVKRGNKYNGIIMDPPAFGLGAKGEKWILDEKLPLLLETASQLLAPGGFLVVNTYSQKIDLKKLGELAANYFSPSEMSVSELWMKTTTEKKLYYGNLLRVEKG
ncbi:MAG: class I SAM-dependent methyltransferase [Flavobacteriia bacterium]|mgnify:CR=1 FL=1|nr:class I SAM-dependent methyltransferase [Flavobacteriia bacterium]OJX37308.1 MAG: SAM-dependent methyltransferase [Flavobacteriia bacterium 40-80]